jgi:hypothetical protein
MRYFKLLILACALLCMVLPASAALLPYQYQGFVSFVIQSGESDDFFNRAYLPAGVSPMTGAPVNGMFWFDPDAPVPAASGTYELTPMVKGVTANLIRINPITHLPIMPPLHFENDIAADPSGFNDVLGMLPGDIWYLDPMDLLVANGFHGLFGWGITGMSTSNPTKWPTYFFNADLPYKMLGVGRFGDMNPNPLAFNFGAVGAWSWSPQDSEFYMIGFSIYKVTQIPEPGTFVLLGAGLAGLVFWRKRR